MNAQNQLLLATSHGLAICEYGPEGWRVSRCELPESLVTCVISRREIILAGTKDGIFRSNDAGDSWQAVNKGLTIRHIRWMAFHPDNPELAFAGSEPAGIHLSRDAGLSWQVRPEVVDYRDRLNWFLPYSPEAGCVRGFVFHGSRGLAAVEVGGVLASDDFGETWALIESEQSAQDIHPDVHSIAIHPASADLVAAPTGGGFFLSRDGGSTWKNNYPNCYCRAVWWHPTDPDHLILGPADGVDRNGRIEETRDGGLSWSEISTGLDLPWHHQMVERFTQVADQLFAVLSNGELLVTTLESNAWQRILPEVIAVHAVAGLNLTNEG
jgi:photosystem II stability/assembly factor-like uncharacterized protein